MKMLITTVIIIMICVLPSLAQLNQVAYSDQKCGLNFIHKSVKVTNRETNPPGNPTPVTLNVSELTSCRKVERAFVWWGVSYRTGSPTNPTLTIVNPQNASSTVNSVQRGQSIAKCWSEIGTRTFRADVTSSITGNGNYRIDVQNDDWEVDGITLLIIYRDFQANYYGRLHIEDGLITDASGATRNHTKTGQTFCAASTFATAFMLVSDLQVQFNSNGRADFIFNGTIANRNVNFWNFETFNTAVPQNQTTYTYEVDPGADCYSILLAGLYTQTTTCRTCPDPLNIQATRTPAEICRGGSVTLNAEGGSTYQWISIPAGFNSTQKSPVVSPTVTTDYIVLGVSADGCESGRDTVRVVVNQPPTARAGNDVNICGGNAVQIGLPATGGTPPYNYQWTPAAGLSATNVAQPIANPLTVTQYIVTVTDSEGCIDRDTVRVGIFSNPTADAGQPNEICLGTSVTLSASGSGGTPPYNYSWTPSGTLSNASIATPIATPNVTTKYFVTVTDANGCQSTDSVVISVLPSPTANAGANTEICFGSSVTIGLPAVGGIAPYTYSWSPTTGLSASDIPQPIAAPTTSTQYIVAVTDANGCIDRDTIMIDVNPLPTIDIGQDLEICFNDTISIGTAAQNGTAPFTYQWTPSEGLNATNLPVVQASPTITTKYFVQVTDSKGCEAIDSLTIVVHPLPQPVIVPSGPTTFCTCDSVILDAGGPFVSYLWSNGETTQTIVVRQSGDFSVTVTDNNGCVNSSSPISTTVIQPQATIAIPETVLRAEPGQNINIPIYIKESQNLDFCKVTNFTAILRYNRSLLVPKGNTPQGTISGNERIIQISGNRTSNDSVLFNMQFLATLGDAEQTNVSFDSFTWNDCGFEVTLLDSVFALDGLCREGGTTRLYKQGQTPIELSVQPNPITETAEILIMIPYETKTELLLYDVLGNKIMSLLDTHTSGAQIRTLLNAESVNSGVYLLVLKTDFESLARIIEVVK